MKEKNNNRLDIFLVNNNFFDSRSKAKQSIERGEVILNNKIITKPSFIIEKNSNIIIEIKAPISFVSLGGYKMQKALNDFQFKVKNKICADIGCSTGGFTDCLLQNGASFVFAVDLNNTLLHKTLLENNKVKLIVKNAKDLQKNDFDKKIDLLVADLSFISITSVIKTFYNLIDEGKHCILLIKPQYEVGERIKFKNGIIKDAKYRIKACKDVFNCAVENGFTPLNISTAPIQKEKNIEYLILLQKKQCRDITFENFIKINNIQ